ncbi:hypothetical protein CHH73_02375 [Shouchella clausii]|jgi:hypothetical protein|nr:hypothetical protein WZ76_03570 [Shouchella clausii]PAD19486.1 hypothetical protein CHH73_02375 [Shouchella clausii]
MALPFIHALTLPQIKFNFCNEQRLFYIIYGLPAFGKIDTLAYLQKKKAACRCLLQDIQHGGRLASLPVLLPAWLSFVF